MDYTILNYTSPTDLLNQEERLKKILQLQSKMHLEHAASTINTAPVQDMRPVQRPVDEVRYDIVYQTQKLRDNLHTILNDDQTEKVIDEMLKDTKRDPLRSYDQSWGEWAGEWGKRATIEWIPYTKWWDEAAKRARKEESFEFDPEDIYLTNLYWGDIATKYSGKAKSQSSAADFLSFLRNYLTEIRRLETTNYHGDRENMLPPPSLVGAMTVEQRNKLRVQADNRMLTMMQPYMNKTVARRIVEQLPWADLNPLIRDKEEFDKRMEGKKFNTPQEFLQWVSENVQRSSWTKWNGGYKGKGCNTYNKRFVRVGRGIKHEPIPKWRQFGRFIIHEPSLKKHSLNLRHKSSSPIPDIPKQDISKLMSDILLDMIENEKINNTLVQMLSKSEQSKLHYICKKAEIADVGLSGDGVEDEDEEYDRFELLKNEVIAGQNAPEVLRELKSHILRFMGDGRLRRNEGMGLLADLAILT